MASTLSKARTLWGMASQQGSSVPPLASGITRPGVRPPVALPLPPVDRNDAACIVRDMGALFRNDECNALALLVAGLSTALAAVVLSMLRHEGQVELARRLDTGRRG